MADRCSEQIKYYEDHGDGVMTADTVSAKLLIIYENFCNEIASDIMHRTRIPCPPGHVPVPPAVADNYKVAKDLNAYYIKFVNMTTKEKLKALFQEEYIRAQIEAETDILTNPDDTPSDEDTVDLVNGLTPPTIDQP